MVLLQIYADSRLKDHIIDAFLERNINNFYYVDCARYAAINLLLSEREQVSGRKDSGSFSLFVDYDKAVELSEILYSKFGKDDIVCFIMQGVERM